MNSLCVFCGSRTTFEEYHESARRLGELIAIQNIRLVYGGGSLGLMGEIAKEVSSRNGRVLGVYPEALIAIEKSEATPGDVVRVSNMGERKERMAIESDGFLCLPGGLGTLDELFEMLTWNQLGFMNKPIGLLNIGGFWDKLLDFLSDVSVTGLIPDRYKDALFVSSDPDQLLEMMNQYVQEHAKDPPPVVRQ